MLAVVLGEELLLGGGGGAIARVGLYRGATSGWGGRDRYAARLERLLTADLAALGVACAALTLERDGRIEGLRKPRDGSGGGLGTRPGGALGTPAPKPQP